MTQQEKENEIQHTLKGKKITAVHYYVMNRAGYFYPNQPEQLVDAAVELTLDNGNVFSFGMNFRFVAIDSIVESYGAFVKAYNRDLPFLKMEVNTDEKWAPVIGKEINQVYVCYNWFEDLEGQKNYIPQDIELILDDNLYLAFCATAYAIDEDGISILGPDSEGEILVLFDEEDTKFFKRGRYYKPAEMDLE
ncbi:MAG TPA: hypothetical protein VD905_10935 [Flavobacteriales bacterium]|nr:hypothetical protein [Flavobacteriales bacterium]